MQANQNWGSRTGLLAIGIAFFILIAGVGSFFLIYKTMRDKVIITSSKLGPMGAAVPRPLLHESDLKSLYQSNVKRIFLLEMKRADGEGIGSGFLYNDKGDILTNAHVVEGTSEVTIKGLDSSLYKGTVIGISNTVDAAVVRVPELAGKSPMKIRKSGKTEVGDEVIAIGNPLGFEGTVSQGMISGLNREFTIDPYPYKYKDVYQIDAPISPGNSGGPLLDKKSGEVIGINSAVSKQGQNIGFSIPIEQVLPLAENWSSHPMTLQAKTDLVYGNQQVQLSQTNAEELVKNYYDLINKQDYVSAYALRGSDMQSSLSYEQFRAGYGQTITVTVQKIYSQQVSDGRVSVISILETKERLKSGELRINHYKTTIQVGYENDRLKLLTGQQETIR